MKELLPLTRDLVLLGGGHAHALVLRKWAMTPLAGARVTLVNPEPTAPYTGMLPGFVAGHYARDDLDIDLVRLCRSAGARLTLAAATGIDPDRKLVMLDRQVPLSFDILSINVGFSTACPRIPGFARWAVPAKPLGTLADGWVRFLAGVGRGERPPCIAVIGGGVGGVELALAFAHRMRSETGQAARISIIEQSSRPLGELSAATRRILIERAGRSGITFHCNNQVGRIDRDSVELTDGRHVEAGFVVSAAGARPPKWLAATGLDLEQGFVRVDEFLRSTSAPDIFAAGDCAHMSRSPRRRAGVYAVRSAPALFRNLRAALTGAPPRRFSPQRGFLKLVSTGGRHAVGERFGLSTSGGWVWRVKDRIDQAFMDKFRDLPEMSTAPLPAPLAAGVREMLAEQGKLCGGCGSKVARPALQEGLAGLRSGESGQVLAGIGDDAAILRWEGVSQVMSTDHLRAFVEDPWLFGRIAAIHALGDIWSMGARPQAALASIVLPRMSGRMLAATQQEIMDAASGVFASEGAEIVGGHTSQGVEMMIGFAVTGIPVGNPVVKSGARPGDRLIMTRPLGTGVILAGEMAGKARGRDVATVWAAMSESSGRAAAILGRRATAMTDVTGFGLAGHLYEILEASGVAASIRMEDVPLLAGAPELASQGIRSSIWQSNSTLSASMTVHCYGAVDLLFDPQTASGLLAAVPAAVAGDALRELENVGETPALVGEIDEGRPWITVN